MDGVFHSEMSIGAYFQDLPSTERFLLDSLCPKVDITAETIDRQNQLLNCAASPYSRWNFVSNQVWIEPEHFQIPTFPSRLEARSISLSSVQTMSKPREIIVNRCYLPYNVDQDTCPSEFENEAPLTPAQLAIQIPRPLFIPSATNVGEIQNYDYYTTPYRLVNNPGYHLHFEVVESSFDEEIKAGIDIRDPSSITEKNILHKLKPSSSSSSAAFSSSSSSSSLSSSSSYNPTLSRAVLPARPVSLSSSTRSTSSAIDTVANHTQPVPKKPRTVQRVTSLQPHGRLLLSGSHVIAGAGLSFHDGPVSSTAGIPRTFTNPNPDRRGMLSHAVVLGNCTRAIEASSSTSTTVKSTSISNLVSNKPAISSMASETSFTSTTSLSSSSSTSSTSSLTSSSSSSSRSVASTSLFVSSSSVLVNNDGINRISEQLLEKYPWLRFQNPVVHIDFEVSKKPITLNLQSLSVSNIKIEHIDLLPKPLISLIRLRLHESVQPKLGYGDPTERIVFVDPIISRYNKITIDEEIYGSACSASDRRAYVLVKSDIRTEAVRSSLKRFNHGHDIVHADDQMLHPARVRCYLKIKYRTCDAQWSDIDSINQPHKVNAVTKTACFALVDFYKIHSMRKTWAWSNAAEICSDIFRDFFITDTQHLVSIHSLAGKFVPGRFTEKFPLIANQWHSGLKHSVSKPMAVLRLPLRNYF